MRLTPPYEKRKDRETNQYQVSKEILSETVDEEAQVMEEKYKAEQEAIQLRLKQEKLQREQEELARRLVSAESIQMLEGTAGKLTEDEIRKIQLRKVKLETRLRKLISAHNLVVASYELNPMLKEKYQILKQNMYSKVICIVK